MNYRKKLFNNPDSERKLSDVLLSYAVFISIGITDGQISVAWPSIRNEFGLPVDALGMLLFSGMTGYLTAGFFSGRLISKFPRKYLITAGCSMIASGFTGYIISPSWWVIVFLGVINGSGNGIISSVISAHLAARYSARVTQWLHACYGIGITLGPLVMTYSITGLHTWRAGYIFVITVQSILAVIHFIARRKQNNADDPSGEPATRSRTDTKTSASLISSIRNKTVFMSILFFFIYAGLESTMGNWAYTLLTASRNVPPETAGIFMGSFWAIYTISRILTGFYAVRTDINKMIIFSAAGSLAGGLLLLLSGSAFWALAAVIIFGFSIAPVYPAMMSSTPSRVGIRYSANAIGMQVGSAGIGVGIIPGLSGVLAGNLGIEIIPAVLVSLSAVLITLCYFIFMRQKHQA